MTADDVRDAIIGVTDSEAAAVAGGDMEAYEEVLAEDAAFLPPNGEARSGTALRAWLQEFLEGFAVEWLRFTHVDVAADGDLAYHSFEYEWRLTPRAGGEPIVSHGKGLHVLRRDERGAWKILREIWNGSPPR